MPNNLKRTASVTDKPICQTCLRLFLPNRSDARYRTLL